MQSIHGHEVLEMILAAGKPFTKGSLEAAIHQKFGTDARFHTCSAEHMTAQELIQFLESRGKFIPEGEGFRTDRDKICHQGDEPHTHS